ncbi:MAG: hypothetical protein KDB14_11985 [Planctomycetales bacterium]|nr:hypothetical protein [Planctomycetales bacterium]
MADATSGSRFVGRREVVGWRRLVALMLLMAAPAAISAQDVARAARSAPPSASNAAPGVLLLQNGNVVEGIVEQIGDYYRVHVGQGEIGIPAAKVQVFANTLADAYLQLRTAKRNTPLGHLELADWCIKHRLFEQAADELLIAMRQEPRHELIPVIQRRLETQSKAARSVAGVQSTSAGQAAVPLNPQPAPIVDANLEHRNGRAGFVQAGYQRPAAPPNPVKPQTPRMSDQPPVVLEEFRREVLPILLNGCAANCCHGSAALGDFELFQPLQRHFTKRLVERNWELVVPWIDQSSPEKSKLLTRALEAHGADKAPFKADDPQYVRLAAWVERQGLLLGGDKRPMGELGPPTAPSTAPPTSVTSAPGAPGAPTPSPTIGSAEQTPSAGGPAAPLGTPAELPAESSDAPSGDPFDPEAFNRRFHPRGKPANQPRP